MNKQIKNAMKALSYQKNRGNRCLKKLKQWFSFPTFLVSSSLPFSSCEDQTHGRSTGISNFGTHFMWKHFIWNYTKLHFRQVLVTAVIVHLLGLGQRSVVTVIS
jgi:hypothetical protein